MTDDGVQLRRGKAKEQPEPALADGAETKKEQTAGGQRKAARKESPYRAKVRAELTDGAFQKLVANLASLVVVGALLWVLVKIGIL
mmetsp:Transcript_36374/g.90741  ORF Transcript_36374/g.90741 Transcript_36374/m.90741 type:complete len:86 (+) Transcript_36374:42-299(+)